MPLARPTMEMQAAYQDFVAEWDAAGESITPYSARLRDMTYAEWLAHTYRLEKAPEEGLMSAHTFFYTGEDGQILGAINIRHRLNDYLYQYGGHIGYGVRPSARRQGHASAMLAQALDFCRSLGLERVMISCLKENMASARTILRAGGVLENEVLEDGRPLQRYWIEMTDPQSEAQEAKPC